MQEPTQKQKEAGNYKKKHIRFQGMQISIENPRGSVRSGTDPGGKKWSVRMRYDYGYIRGTVGTDKDHVDCYIGPHEGAKMAYVVHQRKSGQWDKYDEDKVMLGFDTERDARRAFLAHYTDSRFLGAVTAIPIDEFREKAVEEKYRGHMLKSYVRAHTRTLQDGSVIPVRAYTDHRVAGGEEAKTQNHRTSNPTADSPPRPADDLAMDTDAYRVRQGGPPKQTRKAYKAFRVKNGKIYPLYVGANTPVPIGLWLDAKEGGFNFEGPNGARYIIGGTGTVTPFASLPAESQKAIRERGIKANSLKLLAYRPGWHTGTLPYNPQGAGAKDPEYKKGVRNPEHPYPHILYPDIVIAEVELSADHNYQKEFERGAARYADGRIDTNRSGLRHVPTDGLYQYTTNRNNDDQPGDWLIGGSLRVNRILHQDEINRIMDEAGAMRQLRVGGDVDLKKLGLMVKALNAGERWITVHPNGPEEKGVPVLIRETAPGSGAYRVIGGAGGKLNYLKFHGVKDAAEHKQAALDRRKGREAARKQMIAREKELGIHGAKAAARKKLRETVNEERMSLVSLAAEKLGWGDKELIPPSTEGMTAAAAKRATNQHLRHLLTRAKEEIGVQRKRLLADADARAEALGDVPLTDHGAPETISVADLDDVRPQTGMGMSMGWTKDAKAQGLTEEEVKAEKTRFEETLPEERQEALRKRRENAKRIRGETEEISSPEQKPNAKTPRLIDAKEAAVLLRAEKRLKVVEARAGAAAKAIDKADLVDPDAAILAVGREDVPDTLREDLENDLRTVTARTFLDTLRKDAPDYEKSMSAHIGAGAMASLNGFAIAASGHGMMDRATLETVGISNAAALVATRLKEDLTSAEVEDLLRGLEAYHVETQVDRATKAMDQASQAIQVSREIEASQPEGTGHDLARLQEANKKRIAAIDESRASLGGALGALEMQGALINALRGKPVEKVEVALGSMRVEDAIVRARAMGLVPGDYRITDTAGLRYMEISNIGRLTPKIDAESLRTSRDIADIQAGAHDEDNWLPSGVANRPDLALNLPAGVAEQIAEPFSPGEDLQQSIKDYVGGRTADGDAPVDIMAALHSDELGQMVPNRQDFMATLNALIPMRDGKKNLLRAESHGDMFRSWADDFVAKRYGGRINPLHRQEIVTDDVSLDALHRALSEEPAGISAYKPIGELTGEDQRTLRAYWTEHVGSKDARSEELRAQLDEHIQGEPERMVEDMFGEQSESPTWSAWSQRHQELLDEISSKGLDWDKYQRIMGGRPAAYAAVQDLIRSHVSRAFAEHHNKLRPDAPLKVGRQVIRGNLEHLDATDPDARDMRMAEHAKLVDRLRERSQGKYASGAVRDKIAETRERQEALAQAQMGLFLDDPEPEAEKPLKPDERNTIGLAAERKLAEMMQVVGPNFQPGHPVKLWNASMSGKNVLGQRAIKMIERGKRVALGLGVGTGKTLIGLGGFTHLHSKGAVKKGLFVVPSSVQGQFGAEALRYLEPGKYRWHAEPGGSREDRIAAYKDPNTHFAVVTHQALRDDLLHLGAQRDGIDEHEMGRRLGAMSPTDRSKWAKGLMVAEGINPDYLMVDEGHNLLNRSGKTNSTMANVIDAVSANTPYYVSASADPVRNDVTELHDLMRKLDPVKYEDSGAFLQRYAGNLAANKAELRREINRYLITGSNDPGVQVTKRSVPVEPGAEQISDLKALDRTVARARLARMHGGVDVQAMKDLSPDSFSNVPAEQHEDLARRLQTNLGILRDGATRRVLDDRGRSAKLGAAVQLAGERRGKPGVIFAHNLSVVSDLADKLRAGGHRVAVLTGDMGSKERDAARLAFQPEAGDPSADILVMSDAGATGLNLQRGQWMIQYDTPMTAMTHAQRQGRIHRMGQRQNLEFMDLVMDHPHEDAARKRLKTKYDLREILTDPTIGQDDTGIAGYLAHYRAHKGE